MTNTSRIAWNSSLAITSLSTSLESTTYIIAWVFGK